LKSCLFATFADFSTPVNPGTGDVREISCQPMNMLIDDDKRFAGRRYYSAARKQNGERFIKGSPL